MSDSSTAQVTKLERLLLDGDVNPELEPYLRAVGFRVRFAQRVRVNIRDDVDVLRWARKYGYILVCHDKHKDQKTRIRINRELYERGGQVLQISRDSSQHPITAVGKILVNWEEWTEFFSQTDGRVVVNKQGCRKIPSVELYLQIQNRLDIEGTAQAMQKRRPSKRHRKPRKRPGEQLPMDVGVSRK